MSATTICADRMARSVKVEDLVDIFLVLGDEDFGAGVFKLVAHFGRRTRRVDAVGDRADRKPGHIGDEIFVTRIAHDGDAVAGLYPSETSPSAKASTCRDIRAK